MGYLDADVRLYNSSNEREGIVEIMYQGVWGTICDNGWDDIDATVVCKQLGFVSGIKRILQQPSKANPMPVWLNKVECLGSEKKLSHCIHSGVGNVGSCSHAQDAAVKCSGITGNDRKIVN